MKKILYIAIVLLTAVGCSPDSPYSTSPDTTIAISVRQLSAGYIEAAFTPDRDAYYLVAVDTVVPGIDPTAIEKLFMQMAVDSAYRTYQAWREEQEASGVPEHQIARFRSHSLQYGTTRHYAYFLRPNTDYWIYAFSVNPENHQPVSRLFVRTVHTLPESPVICYFQYRIRDQWDYVYPLDATLMNIHTAFPYVAATVDSVTVRRVCAERGISSPALFFLDSLEHVMATRPDDYRILHGIYAHNNDGIGDGSSDTHFVDGETYYTAFAGVDGSTRPGRHQSAVYRFTWHERMDTVFPFSAMLAIDEW